MNSGLDFGQKRETVCGGLILLTVVYISRMVFLKMTLKAETCKVKCSRNRPGCGPEGG